MSESLPGGKCFAENVGEVIMINSPVVESNECMKLQQSSSIRYVRSCQLKQLFSDAFFDDTRDRCHQYSDVFC